MSLNKWPMAVDKFIKKYHVELKLNRVFRYCFVSSKYGMNDLEKSKITAILKKELKDETGYHYDVIFDKGNSIFGVDKEQVSPKGAGREITPLVIADLQSRSDMGKKKYGEPLKAFNGRDSMMDLYQEILDAAVYCRQVMEEKEKTIPEGFQKLIERIEMYCGTPDAAEGCRLILKECREYRKTMWNGEWKNETT